MKKSLRNANAMPHSVTGFWRACDAAQSRQGRGGPSLPAQNDRVGDHACTTSSGCDRATDKSPARSGADFPQVVDGAQWSRCDTHALLDDHQFLTQPNRPVTRQSRGTSYALAEDRPCLESSCWPCSRCSPPAAPRLAGWPTDGPPISCLTSRTPGAWSSPSDGRPG